MLAAYYNPARKLTVGKLKSLAISTMSNIINVDNSYRTTLITKKKIVGSSASVMIIFFRVYQNHNDTTISAADIGCLHFILQAFV